jgi:hypothetical protein
MASKRFDKRLHVLVSSDEFEMVERLAERDGLTPSDVVRRLIRQAFGAVFGDQPTVRVRRGALGLKRK